MTDHLGLVVSFGQLWTILCEMHDAGNSWQQSLQTWPSCARDGRLMCVRLKSLQLLQVAACKPCHIVQGCKITTTQKLKFSAAIASQQGNFCLMPMSSILPEHMSLVLLVKAVLQCWLSTAGDLERSERDILNLRSQQGRFEERVAMMQGLLKVCMSEHLWLSDE